MSNTFNATEWNFNKIDKSKLTKEQINRAEDTEMKKLFELWSDYLKNYKNGGKINYLNLFK